MEYPRIDLQTGEKEWLEAVYDHWRKQEEVDSSRLRLELHDRIPPDFDPSEIDSRLLHPDQGLTPLGIVHADPETNLLQHADRVIKEIKSALIENPGKRDFTIEEVSEMANLPEEHTRQVIRVMGRLGSFIDSRGTDRIGMKNDSTIREYRGYEDIESHLQQKYVENWNSYFQTSGVEPARSLSPPIPEVPGNRTFWDLLHDDIVEVSKVRYQNGHHADAVFSAMKEVINRVRIHHKSETGTELDGRDLMFKTFNPQDPVIELTDRQDQIGWDIQEGYSFLFAGATQAIRNPKAHDNLEIDPEEALDLLAVSSLLMKRLDQAEVPRLVDARTEEEE